MGIIDSAVRTITCNNAECSKTITYDRRTEKETFDLPGNEWMKAVRLITTADNRQLAYCSDECEIKGITNGSHNLPQPKRIIDGVTGQAQIAAAAAAAKQAEAATAAIKDGRPTQVSI